MATPTIFNSGVLSNTSTYGSGTLSDIYLTGMPTMILKETVAIDGTYDVGLTSVAIHSPVTDKWNFYLEAIHDVVSGVPTYITYTASGSNSNQYGLYKESLELHVGTSGIYSLKTQGYIWAQTVSGNYITGRIPVYFRRLG